MTGFKNMFLLAAVLTTTVAAAAEPQVSAPVDSSTEEKGPQKLGVFAGIGYLGSPGAHGSALTAGVRYAMGRHAALSFDLGYGVITASPIVHDRWWLMPAVAFVIPAGRAKFDLGVGAGFATSSGYDNMDQFLAEPFMPVWAFQLVPAVRGHAIASMQLNDTFDAFARLDVGTLLLDGNTIGLRDGNPRPGIMDTMWLNLAVGVSFRAL
jgi:hypothetical protein